MTDPAPEPITLVVHDAGQTSNSDFDAAADPTTEKD